MVKLENLSISNSNILQFSPLSSLISLSELTISGGSLTDTLFNNFLASIESLPKLTSLNISGNSITDLSPLSGFSQLTTLDASENPLANNDITPVQSLINLNSLTVDNICQAGIMDLGVLTLLPKLASLSVSGNNITDLNVIASLLQLTSLNLGTNPIGNEKFKLLSSLINLTDFSITNSQQLSDISFLSQLTKLTTLNLGGNERLVNIDPLSSLASLASLTLSDCIGVASPKALTSITELRQLNLFNTSGANTQDWRDFIARQTQLNELTMNNVALENIDFIKNLTNLVILGMSTCNISDISPLENLAKLEILEIGTNSISDISSLSKLDKLKHIIISECLLTSLSDLQELKNLRQLNVEYNFLTDFSEISSFPYIVNFMMAWNFYYQQPSQLAFSALPINIDYNMEQAVSVELYATLDGISYESSPYSIHNLELSVITCSNTNIAYQIGKTTSSDNKSIEAILKGADLGTTSSAIFFQPTTGVSANMTLNNGSTEILVTVS